MYWIVILNYIYIFLHMNFNGFITCLVLSVFSNKKYVKMLLMSLVAHRFGRVEYWIFVIFFFRQMQLKKSKQIFEIRHVQIDDRPRNLFKKYMEESELNTQSILQRYIHVIFLVTSRVSYAASYLIRHRSNVIKLYD